MAESSPPQYIKTVTRRVTRRRRDSASSRSSGSFDVMDFLLCKERKYVESSTGSLTESESEASDPFEGLIRQGPRVGQATKATSSGSETESEDEDGTPGGNLDSVDGGGVDAISLVNTSQHGTLGGATVGESGSGGSATHDGGENPGGHVANPGETNVDEDQHSITEAVQVDTSLTFSDEQSDEGHTSGDDYIAQNQLGDPNILKDHFGIKAEDLAEWRIHHDGTIEWIGDEKDAALNQGNSSEANVAAHITNTLQASRGPLQDKVNVMNVGNGRNSLDVTINIAGGSNLNAPPTINLNVCCSLGCQSRKRKAENTEGYKRKKRVNASGLWLPGDR